MKPFFTCLLLFSFIHAILLSQDSCFNNFDENGKKTGYWREFYDNGKIRYEGKFLEDHPVGEITRYYKGGTLQAKMLYTQDKREAYVKLYYENGKIAAEGRFIDKVKDSTWNFYSSYNEQLILKEYYLSGKRHGESIKLYPGRQISEKLIYELDSLNGSWEQYFENGTKRLSGNYLNGKREGEFRSWNAEGKPSIQGFYKNGVMHGKWKYFDQNGEVDIVVVYNNGVMEYNKEVEKLHEEFSRRVEESIGNYSEPEMNQFR